MTLLLKNPIPKSSLKFIPSRPIIRSEASIIQKGAEHAMEAIEDAVMAVYKEMIENGQLDDEPAQQEKVSA